MAWAFLALQLVGTLYIAIIVPESPLFLFGRGDYEQARKNLTEVAHFNGVYKVRGRPYDQFRFPKEKALISSDNKEINY